MSAIGSVFLGDFTRNRVWSSGTPPASPPPFPLSQSPTSMASVAAQQPSTQAQPPADEKPITINSDHSTELRLRWLEAIVLGVKPDDFRVKSKSSDTIQDKDTLIHAVENIQKRLNAAVQSNDGVKKFMEQYDKHTQFLTPTFALSGTVPSAAPVYQDMTPTELEAFLVELEPDIKAADRDMREIEALEAKDVLGAGKLRDYEQLQPRLEALISAHEKDLQLAASLESRIDVIMEKHATTVDALSELFVDWDDTLTQCENKISKFNRDRKEKRRLGLEDEDEDQHPPNDSPNGAASLLASETASGSIPLDSAHISTHVEYRTDTSELELAAIPD